MSLSISGQRPPSSRGRAAVDPSGPPPSRGLTPSQRGHLGGRGPQNPTRDAYDASAPRGYAREHSHGHPGGGASVSRKAAFTFAPSDGGGRGARGVSRSAGKRRPPSAARPSTPAEVSELHSALFAPLRRLRAACLAADAAGGGAAGQRLLRRALRAAGAPLANADAAAAARFAGSLPGGYAAFAEAAEKRVQELLLSSIGGAAVTAPVLQPLGEAGEDGLVAKRAAEAVARTTLRGIKPLATALTGSTLPPASRTGSSVRRGGGGIAGGSGVAAVRSVATSNGRHLSASQARSLAAMVAAGGSGTTALGEPMLGRDAVAAGLAAIAGRRVPRNLADDTGDEPPPPPERSDVPLADVSRVESMLQNKLFSKFRKVQDAFKSFDGDRSGKINRSEFRAALEAASNTAITDAEFAEFCRKYDADNDGQISYVEFQNNVGKIVQPGETGHLIIDHSRQGGAANTQGGSELAGWVESRFAQSAIEGLDKVADSFSTLDLDGSGQLSYAEFGLAFKRAGMRLSDEEMAALCGKYDTNGDGQVSLQEFQSRMVGALERPASPRAADAWAKAEAAKKAKEKEGASKSVVTSSQVNRKLQEHIFAKFSKVQNAYRIFDNDKSGMITHEEFRQSLATLGLTMSDDEFQRFIREYDPSGDGVISYVEFNNKVAQLIHPSEGARLAIGKPARNTVAAWVEEKFARQSVEGLDNVREAFDKFDKDKSGALSQAEFNLALRHTGVHLSEEEAAHLYDTFDVDHDGTISYIEFSARIGKLFQGKLHEVRKSEMGPAAEANARRKFVRKRRAKERANAKRVVQARRERVEAATAAAAAIASGQAVVLAGPAGTSTSAAGHGFGGKSAHGSPSRLPPRPQTASSQSRRRGPGNVGTLKLGPLSSSGSGGLAHHLSDGASSVAVTVLSGASSLSTAADLEAQIGGRVGGRAGYTAIFRALRSADEDRGADTGSLPVTVAQDVLEECGLRLSDSDMSALLRKHRRRPKFTAPEDAVAFDGTVQDRFDYVSFMRAAFIESRHPVDVAVPANYSRAKLLKMTQQQQQRSQQLLTARSGGGGGRPTSAPNVRRMGSDTARSGMSQRSAASGWSMTGDAAADRALRHAVRKDWKALRRGFADSGSARSGLVPKKTFNRVLQSFGVPLSARETSQAAKQFTIHAPDGPAVDYTAFLKAQLMPV